jgi:hypothetical protein
MMKRMTMKRMMKRMTMKRMMKKMTMKMTMTQQPHLHLKRRKILQMRMEIPSHTTTWGPEDTALASTSTYSKKEKCHAAEWQNQIVCIVPLALTTPATASVRIVAPQIARNT